LAVAASCSCEQAVRFERDVDRFALGSAASTAARVFGRRLGERASGVVISASTLNAIVGRRRDPVNLVQRQSARAELRRVRDERPPSPRPRAEQAHQTAVAREHGRRSGRRRERRQDRAREFALGGASARAALCAFAGDAVLEVADDALGKRVVLRRVRHVEERGYRRANRRTAASAAKPAASRAKPAT
jgi:hypothetical protein